MRTHPISILIVDDHPVVRLGLRTLLSRNRRIVVIGEVETAAAAHEEARRHQPDIVLLDVVLPDGSGMDVCRAIRAQCPKTRVIMLTTYPDREAVIESIRAGADGYLLKQTDLKQLVHAVEIVTDGGTILDPAVAGPVVEWLRQQDSSLSPNDPLAVLTPQERRVLPYLARGMTNREIAAEFILSEHTVKGYVSSILQKLHLTRRAEAAAYIARYQKPGRAPTSS